MGSMKGEGLMLRIVVSLHRLGTPACLFIAAHEPTGAVLTRVDPPLTWLPPPLAHMTEEDP
jgi:hypothetical protein